MIRVVLGVLLAVALFGTTAHALDTAARDHGNAQVERAATQLTTAMADLRERETAVQAGEAGARRVVTVRLPEDDATTAPAAYLAIGGRPGADGAADQAPAVAWRVAGSHERTRHVTDVRVVGEGNGADTASRAGVLVLESPGTHHLALMLVEREGRETVVVTRLSHDD